jgi:hypothetical protein
MDANNKSRKDAAAPANSPAGLPEVESPKLAPGQSESAKSDVSDHKVSTAVALFKGGRPDADGELDHASWFANKAWPHLRSSPFAAAVALSLGIGLLSAAVGVFVAGSPPKAMTVASVSETAAYKDQIAQLSADVATLKAAQEAAIRSASAQLKGIGERIERAERAQAEPAARLVKLSDSVDRLERRVAASIVPPATIAAVAAPNAGGTSIHPGNRSDITGAIPLPPKPVLGSGKDTARLPIIQGWTLRRVVAGTAFIYSQEGMIEVGIGDALPGGGRVEDIRRERGRWVVVTSRGLVVAREAPPRPRASLTVLP